MCNVTIVPRHKRHNSSHSKPQQQHIHVAAGLPRDLRFGRQFNFLQTKLRTSNTLSRHKVAATKTHKGSASNHSKQRIHVAAGLPRDLSFSRQFNSLQTKLRTLNQTHCRDIKSLLRKHITVRHQITASNT